VKRMIACLCMLCFLVGCSGYRELEELQIVAGLYLDVTPEGLIRVTAETVDFSDGTEKPMGYTAEGEGIDVCMTRMMDQCGRELYLSHAEVIAISRAYAQTRLRELTEYILHDHFLRFTTAIVVSETEDASELVMESSETVQSYAIARLLENHANTGRTISKESYKSIRELYDIGETTVFPVVMRTENGVAAQGSAVVGKNGLLILDDTQTMFFNLLCGTFRNGSIGLTLGLQDISVEIEAEHTKRSCDASDGIIRYYVDTKLSVQPRIASDSEELTTVVRTYLSEELHDLYDELRLIDADALGVLRLLRGTHPEQYRTMEDDASFRESVLSIRTEIHTKEVIG